MSLGNKLADFLNLIREKNIKENPHSFKIENDKIYYKNGEEWVEIDIDLTEIRNMIEGHPRNLIFFNDDGVHSIKYIKKEKKLQFKYYGDWYDVDFSKSKDLERFDSSLIKYNANVTVSKGDENIKSLTGTFTDDGNVTSTSIAKGYSAYAKGTKYSGNFTEDANATSNDIINGKTGYVKGSKITGNIRNYSGDIKVSTPSLSGSYFYTPYISRGLYSGSRLYFDSENLTPSNIKKNVNIFGVNGTYENTTMKSPAFTLTVFGYRASSTLVYQYVTLATGNRNIIDSWRSTGEWANYGYNQIQKRPASKTISRSMTLDVSITYIDMSNNGMLKIGSLSSSGRVSLSSGDEIIVNPTADYNYMIHCVAYLA